MTTPQMYCISAKEIQFNPLPAGDAALPSKQVLIIGHQPNLSQICTENPLFRIDFGENFSV